jgi:hypothetical protein
MSDRFHNYLNFRILDNVNEKKDCAFIKLKKHEVHEDEKTDLKQIYEEISQTNHLIKYPFLIGYDRHFNKMQGFYDIYNSFKKRKEVSLEYGQACFLFLQVMDEMMYDEFRSLSSDLSEILKCLIQKEKNLETALLLLASLYFNYVSPEFIEILSLYDFEDKLYQELKAKLAERMPIW